MRRARPILATLAVFVALLPATASLCWACMPCQGAAAPSDVAAEPAGTGHRPSPPCHAPAQRLPELVAGCCCDGAAAGRTADETPRFQAPAVDEPLPSGATPAVLSPASRPRVPLSAGPPLSGRERLSRHRVFLI